MSTRGLNRFVSFVVFLCTPHLLCWFVCRREVAWLLLCFSWIILNRRSVQTCLLPAAFRSFQEMRLNFNFSLLKYTEVYTHLHCSVEAGVPGRREPDTKPLDLYFYLVLLVSDSSIISLPKWYETYFCETRREWRKHR